MNIQITINASPELLEALQSIAAAFGGAAKKVPAASKAATKDELKDAATPVLTPITTTVAEAAKEEKVTVESLRELVTDKVSKNKKAEVKAVLEQFGAKNVSALDASKYVEFHKALNQL